MIITRDLLPEVIRIFGMFQADFISWKISLRQKLLFKLFNVDTSKLKAHIEPDEDFNESEEIEFEEDLGLLGEPDEESEYKPPVAYIYFHFFEIVGSSTVFFSVDTTAPRITVLSLEKQTLYTSNVPLNFTVNELTTQIKES